MKYLSVIGLSAVKFMGGPIAAASMKLHWLTAGICSVVGMMLTVVIVLFAGEWLQPQLAKWFSRKKSNPFSRRNRWAVKIKQKLGIWGIAFLTPVLFTPPFGAALAVAFGFPRATILMSMLVSAAVWAVICVVSFYWIWAKV